MAKNTTPWANKLYDNPVGSGPGGPGPGKKAPRYGAAMAAEGPSTGPGKTFTAADIPEASHGGATTTTVNPAMKAAMRRRMGAKELKTATTRAKGFNPVQERKVMGSLRKKAPAQGMSGPASKAAVSRRIAYK